MTWFGAAVGQIQNTGAWKVGFTPRPTRHKSPRVLQWKIVALDWEHLKNTPIWGVSRSPLYFYCKERLGLTGGGCCPLQFWQTHAVKSDKLLKDRRTLTELRTALNTNSLKCVKVGEPKILAKPQTEQPCKILKPLRIGRLDNMLLKLHKALL